MVFNCRLFYFDVEEEAAMVSGTFVPAPGKKKWADERKSTKTKSKSKQAATDAGKKNTSKAAKEPKIVVEPMKKTVKASGGREIKRTDQHPVAAAAGPKSPSITNIPPANANARSLPPVPPPAVNLPVHWRDIRAIEEEEPSKKWEFNWSGDDDKRLPGQDKATRLAEDNFTGNNKKKLLNSLDSGHWNLESNDLESTGKLVLKMTLHCEGCVHKIRRAVMKFEGVKGVAFDTDRDLVTVTGRVKEEKLLSYLERKLNKKIAVVLPARPNGAEEAVSVTDGRDPRGQKPEVSGDDRGRKKAEEGPVKLNGEETAWSAAGTGAGIRRESNTDIDKLSFHKITSILNLRIKLHCNSCIEKIHAAIAQVKGVDSVNFHVSNNLVTVAGEIDARELVLYLKTKLKHDVEVVSVRRSIAPVDEGPVKRVTPATLPPTYAKDASEKGSSDSSTNDELPLLEDCKDSTLASYNQSSYDVYCSGCSIGGYHCLYSNRITDMFSDENVNACSIM